MKPVTPLEPQPELATAIGVKELFLKREDMHPYHSHKGRSLPPMIDKYVAAGERRFAISSSGNAAIAAAMHIHELNAGTHKTDPIDLDVFMGRHVAPEKADRLKKMDDGHVKSFIKERPRQALAQAVSEAARSLRQSTDDEALKGYKSLAMEIVEGLKPFHKAAVFMATSSGTTSQALAEHFIRNKLPIQVHIVQTSSCHPIAARLSPYNGPDERSSADAITDIIAYREATLVPLVKKTGGTGWIATNEDLSAALELSNKHARLDISANGALPIAALMRAASSGFSIPDKIVCVIGGR